MNFFKAFVGMFFLLGDVLQVNAAVHEPFSIDEALHKHVNVTLNGEDHSLEFGSIIALSERVVGKSTPEKRKLKAATFTAIRDGLGHVRSAIANGEDIDTEEMRQIIAKLLKNCVKAHHKDVNVMLGKLGLSNEQEVVLKTSLSNAATLLTSEDPVSIEGVVVFCFKTAATVAEQLLAKK